MKSYQDIIRKIIYINPSILDAPDRHGRSPLHCFLDGIRGYKAILEVDAICEIVKILKTDQNVDAVDHDGQTALHILLTILPLFNKESDEKSHNTISKLVRLLKSEKNVGFQNSDGETVLHLLARTIFLFPKTKGQLIKAITILSTNTNVNALDSDGVAPYCWILCAKSECQEEMEKSLMAKLDVLFTKLISDTALVQQQKGIEFIRWVKLADKIIIKTA